jgi:hypothetical protein
MTRQSHGYTSVRIFFAAMRISASNRLVNDYVGVFQTASVTPMACKS